MGFEASDVAQERKYFFHFPDGNASIARLLVRSLVPSAIPGHSATDIVAAKADYAKLDKESSPIRIRLNSTAVRVRHIGDVARAKEVEVAYALRDKVYMARAKNVILACWNAVIPYICDELPEKQKKDLLMAQKVPLLYTNVLLRNSTSPEKLAANAIYAPGGYHTNVDMDLPVSIGEYQCRREPGEAVLLDMSKGVCQAGLSPREQHTMGRIELFTTDFPTIERNVREQLARILGQGGFDPGRDILAITVNRWPHGYAYEYSTLWDSAT